MKVISERISIIKKESLLSIVILPTANKKKLMILFLWLMAWSVCGVIVFVSYFNLTSQSAKAFVIVYLSFWAYFEFSIARTYMWKRWGKEKLWFQNGILHYQRELNSRGKIHKYNLDLIGKMRLIELNRTSFTDTISQSFWVNGGERLEFKVLAKTVRLGMQLNDEEARSILNETNMLIKDEIY